MAIGVRERSLYADERDQVGPSWGVIWEQSRKVTLSGNHINGSPADDNPYIGDPRYIPLGS